MLIFMTGRMLMAAEVIMIQREFPSKNGEDFQPADVYINAYYAEGELLSVARKMFIKTPESMQKLMGLEIPFCLVKVIYSKNNISIGRVVYTEEKDRLPNIEHYSPFVGDKITSPDKNMIRRYRKNPEVSFSRIPESKPSQAPIQKKEEEKFEIVL